MAGLRHDQIDDFVTLTLSKFIKHKFTDLALELTEYIAQMIINEKKVEYQGGKDISWRIKTKNIGTARNSGLYDTDVTAVDDVMVSASTPWFMQTTNFSYDIYEDLFQSDGETIIRELKIREQSALSDMAELQEENLWSAPTSTTDNRPMGIPFWLQKDPTTTPSGAFNGGNPSGFSSGAAGVSSTTYPRWANWTFGYTSVTTADMVKKVKKALRFTEFRSPVPTPELGWGNHSCEMYTTYDVIDDLERLAESRNDNLGKDVAKYMNQVTIGGCPVKFVHYLENNDSSKPIYGVNWKVFRPYVKTGCNMRRNKPKEAARQHTVREVHIDNWMNYTCVNRRACFSGSVA